MLKITETQLPNETLSVGWYNGQKLVIYLYFIWIAIATIEPNAFNAPAFSQLQLLEIENLIHIVDYRVDTFNGLRKLNGLRIVEMTESEQKLPEGLLQPLHARLKQFFYEGDIGEAPVLTNLFGTTKLLALKFILTDCRRKSMYQTIAAANFTGLSSIHELSLCWCGIETIEIGAFDRIAKTLIAVYLHGNQFLQFDLSRFRCFLDERPRNSKLLPRYLIFYQPPDPQYSCSFEFYRIRNATMISLHYSSRRYEYLLCENDIHKLSRSENDRQQIIHPQRWRLNHAEVYKYAFRKFQMHFNVAKRSLSIRQFDPDSYRLVWWTIREKTMIECRTTKWLRANVKCQRRNRTIETIDIPQFGNDVTRAAVCIIHISMWKQSVPLHCRTIRLTRATDDYEFSWMHQAMLICIILLMLMGSTIFICTKYSLPSAFALIRKRERQGDKGTNTE